MTQTLVPTVHTEGTSQAQSLTHNTGNVTPVGSRPTFVIVASALTGGLGAAPTGIAGAGIAAFSLVASVASSNGNLNLSLWRGTTTTPSTGPLTITHAANMGGIDWKVISWAGADITGTNGSGAVGGFKTYAGASTTPSTTLDNAVETGNATVSFLGYNASSANTITLGAGNVALGANLESTSPACQLAAEWDETGTTTSGAWTTGNAGSKAVITFELVASADAAPTPVVCDAGADQTGKEFNTTVTLPLAASGGTGPFSFAVTPPAGITLSGSGSSRTFVVPGVKTAQNYTFTVVATDSLGATGSDTVTVSCLPWNLFTMRGGVEVPKRIATRVGGVLT